MKAIKTEALKPSPQSDPVKATIEHEQTKADQMVAKSHTFRQSDLAYINEIAFQLSREKNKVVPASEALRKIIGQHREANS